MTISKGSLVCLASGFASAALGSVFGLATWEWVVVYLPAAVGAAAAALLDEDEVRR